MRRKLHEGFDSWLKQNLNIDSGDFAALGNMILANVVLSTETGKKVPYTHDTIFQVFQSPDGKTYKLVDQGKNDPHDKEKSDFPHSSGHGLGFGKEYVISSEEYEKLLQFRKQPQPAGGGMGM